MEYICEVFDQKAQPTLSMRQRINVKNLPAALGETYAALGAHLAEQGGQPAGPPYVAYFNMNMQDLDIEIGFPLAFSVAGKGKLKAGELPAGRILTTLHVGPYPTLDKAYGALMAYAQAHSLQPNGTVYEFYLNDPQTTPPEDLQTRIVFLLG